MMRIFCRNQRLKTRVHGALPALVECRLLLLLPAVLGLVLPAKCIVAATRVCKQLPSDLIINCSSIVLRIKA
eukprot:2379159-Rhodomonas_salina.2